ncbi:unnamed protein product [Rotaria sordida]|uniref:Uncharacterized protein n=2 Tax=Rotaria sordida TaxID=392033 RepID=A0A815JLP4_9BILA|nr:unnamed protein product [Rotaria sordida]
MASRPRLYARSRARKTNSPLSPSYKPDVLVLLDDEADSNIIVGHLSKTPILCQVIVLLDVNALNQYYRSHDSNDDCDKWVYLIRSDSFIEQINELASANDNFYSISTSQYTLALEGVCRVFDEEFRFFHDEERLVKALRDHLNSFLTLDDVELSSQSVSLQTARFAWFQFMFALLSDLERSDIGMQEVIHKLRIDYQSQPDIVEEFIQTYSSEKAMEWCMKDSFFFGHINHTLRSKNIKDIFTHRTIIRDVERNLISWHYDQKQIWEFFLPMNVYRGQKTSIQELKSWQSNIGSIITMTSFLSTSMDEKIAEAFAETFDNDDNDDAATLFTIWVDKNIAPKAYFAYLYHADCEPDDHEILLSLRTLFRIDKVEYDDSAEIWNVNMTVVDENNEEVQRVLAPWKTSILKKNYLQSAAKPLIYVRDLSADNEAFLSFQLALDIILRLDRNDFARQEMLSMCRTKFSHDRFTLAKIDRFEMNYQSEQDAAKWYTADSFLYRLLNEVLRIETIEPIFKLRYFIQDLHNQLALMQVDYLKRLKRYNSPVVKLYRGQIMTRDKLENTFRVNKGNLISMNNFLSTTTDRYVARLFASDGYVQNLETEVSVLYEIEIDTRLSHSVPFAELADQSIFEHEDEVLFSMGAVFRIGETFEEHRYLWTVKLILTTEEDEQWNVLTEHLSEEQETTNQISTQTSMVDDANDDIKIIPIATNKNKRSRSFDGRHYSKREFRRSHWPETFRLRMSRQFEHPDFQPTCKEI